MTDSHLFFPPIVQSAMTGISTIQFCEQMMSYGVGLAILGGYSLDKKSEEASYLILKRGRREFMFPSSEEDLFIWEKSLRNLTKLSDTQKIAINVRITKTDTLAEKRIQFLTPLVDYIELNAHCRQEEFIRLGSGEVLSQDLDRLSKVLQFLQSNNDSKPIGIKVRGYQVLNLHSFLKLLERYDIAYIHVDAMVVGKNETDYSLIKEIVKNTSIPVIANNSVTSVTVIKNYLKLGAKAVSLARPLLKDPLIMKELVDDFQSEFK